MKAFMSLILLGQIIAVSALFIYSHVSAHDLVETSHEGQDYIVYMGGPTSAIHHPVDLLISTIQSREKNRILQIFKIGFSGFAAHITDEEADLLRRHPRVVSVFPNPVLQLHTTRSWDFLDSLSKLHVESSSSVPSAPILESHIIIGIWPESQSFGDQSMGQVPLKWKGVCMAGDGFNASHCNRKLIGARYYADMKTARDEEGHGTHVASTASGGRVPNASCYGLASGTARGGSPASCIATYKVCASVFCTGLAVLATFEDAIVDGVDVLSISMGMPSPELFSTDPISIGSLHAVLKGITVVCSAGTAGPFPMTVQNVAPWIITVAATTLDREYVSYAVLGNGKLINGSGAGIEFGSLEKSPVYPLITGASAKLNNRTTLDEARRCEPGARDEKMIRGKLVVCEGDETIQEVKSKGGVGIILINDQIRGSNSYSFQSFPMTAVSSKDGDIILKYINSTRNPIGTILPTKTVSGYKPAPIMTLYSSRGPSRTTRNILKPDIAAPGDKILAAWRGDDPLTPRGMRPQNFQFAAGTSMACPHVSGVAATVKARYQGWSPAAIRSTIMTLAIQWNNMKEPLADKKGQVATPYDCGAGVLNSAGALDPGLVYDMGPEEYLQFLCFDGYNVSLIKQIMPSLPASFECQKDSGSNRISDINYPSISVHKDVAASPVLVTRRLTNVAIVDDARAVYDVSVIPLPAS